MDLEGKGVCRFLSLIFLTDPLPLPKPHLNQPQITHSAILPEPTELPRESSMWETLVSSSVTHTVAM